MTKLSFNFFPNRAKKNPKTNKTPIYLRVILNCKKAEHRLNLELDDKTLSLWNPVIMRVEAPDCTENDHLDNISTSFKRFLALNDHHISTFNAIKVRNLVMQLESPEQITLIDYINKYYLKAISNKNELSKGTKINYRKAINHMVTFLTFNKLLNKTVKEIDNALADEFKNYLLNDCKELNKKGMAQPSALGIIKKFRTIFNKAVNDDLISKNPFNLVKLSNKSPKKPRLNIHQVSELVHSESKLTITEMVYKDIFLFSVFTGLAYIDAANFKREYIEYRANGDVKLSTERKKTGEFAEQFLNDFAVAIIDKYKNDPNILPYNNVIPKKSNKEINIQLKIIAAKIGIPFKVSSHTARHTFRQLLSESGIEDDAVIKRMMGQSRTDAVDNVYYEVTETRLMEARNRFNNFLKLNLG